MLGRRTGLVKRRTAGSVKFDIAKEIIGGMFGLENPLTGSGSKPPFISDDSLLLVNARSGIRLLVERLSPSTVWLPSYLCLCVIDAVKTAGGNVRFYDLKDDLAHPSPKSLSQMRRDDLVLVIDFFGFPTDESWIRQAQERGARVVEDACQALLTKSVGAAADFVLFSPRKFLGVPDGGILNSKRGHDLESVQLESPPADWWLKTWFATILRREFDLHGGSRHWFDLFQETEADTPIGKYAMSELSKLLLAKAIPYQSVAQRRINNYNVLARSLSQVALFSSPSRGVVPLGFPIRVKKREILRRKLFDHQIFPPVHWPLGNVVPDEFERSHQLSAEILTLPCDQRYGEAEMEWMAQVVSSELNQ
jgi:dTDP-4-amino-4,6-dideoxygalactose transaminase